MFCNKASPNFNQSYWDYDEIAKDLFHMDEVWISRNLLTEVTELVAKYHGFTI